ncbi:MAG: lysylphosphatidylglycerol synthase transmembrane domain-containing protein [Candidatus Spechtbacterales bacterium]
MNLIKKISTKKIIVLLLATLIIFALIFRTSVQFDELISVLRNAKIVYIMLAILAGFAGTVLGTIRWYLLIRITNYHVSFRRIFALIMATWTLSIIPGRIGDFAKAYPLRKSIPIPISIGTIAFEKIIDVISLLFLSMAGFFYIGMPRFSLLLLTGIAALVVFLLLTQKIHRYFPPKIADFVRNALTVLVMAKSHKMALTGSVLASAVNWLMSIAIIFFLFLAFDVHINIPPILAYLPLAIIIGLLPISVAGMGTRDSALIFFLLPFAPAAEILAVGLGYSFIGYFLFAILGIPYLIKEIRTA